MKRIVHLGIVTAIFCATALAQQDVVHFKKLQDFLPKTDLPEFTRGKPTGSTSAFMGMKTSEASVRYVKPPATDTTQEESIEIKISDMSLMPFAAWAMQYQQADFENETEEGYEKSTLIRKKYKGIEKAQTGDYQSCEINFSVGNRFNVTVSGNNFASTKTLMLLIDGMDLEGLEKLQPEPK